MLLRKKFIVFILFLLFAEFTFGQSIKILNNKDFAISGELMQHLILTDSMYNRAIVHLELQDSEGLSIVRIKDRVKDGELLMNYYLPNELNSGWYSLFIYTLDEAKSEFQQLFVFDLPVYSLGEDYPITESNSSEQRTSAFGTIDQAKLAYDNWALLSSKNSNTPLSDLNLNWTNIVDYKDKVPAKNYFLKLKIEESSEREFVAFFNHNTQSIEGLKNQGNKTYSLEIKDLSQALTGQILSVDAFSNVRLLNSEILKDNIVFPELAKETRELPINPSLVEYIDRYRKRLTIYELFEQRVLIANSNEVKNQMALDVIYKTQEYIQFQNIPEFINEVIPVLKYNNRKGTFSVLSESKKYLNNNPLLIANGVILPDNEMIFNSPYKDLISVEVIRTNDLIRKYYSAFGRNGVVRFELVNAEFPENLKPFFWSENNTMYLFDPNGGPDFREAYFFKLDKNRITEIDSKHFLIDQF